MSTYTQKERRLRLETPLGEDLLLLTRLDGQEEISRGFAYDLEMLSTDDAISPKDIVGKNITVALKLPDDSLRCFNGHISEFAYCGTNDRLSRYEARVVPWLWFLRMTTNCRIFQEMSVPDIIEKVFADHGFSHYEISGISGNHPTWEYCVQYRESDFDFVSRLMEKEGIFYYFRHEKGRHVLVLADARGGYMDCPEKEVQHLEPGGLIGESGVQITGWAHHYRYRPGKWAHTDYNFKTPTADLTAMTNTVVDLEKIKDYERFDYPGEHVNKGDSEAEVRLRMEEEEASHDVVDATSRCRTFSPGGRFTITRHYNKAEEGKSYVITRIRHRAMEVGGYETGGETSSFDYTNEFSCIPSTQTFRPARTTPRARVSGVQTAMVVGPQGEEIYTDEFGRVKVQFFWDREGKRDDKSSCWIRVIQPWAGGNWGAIRIPRIGQEVVVDFLEGNPDRPIITGSVYNADQMPPYGLPDNKTQSGVKSRSSLQGEASNFNELRFEDKKGQEDVYLHAEKDMNVVVENDRTEDVGHDETISIGHDRTESVGNDEKLEIKSNRTDSVGKNETRSVGDNRTREVGKDEEVSIGQNRKVAVEQDESRTIGGSQEVSVGKNRTVQVGKELVIDAGDSIILKTGAARIQMKSDGSILIQGKDLTLKASGKIVGQAASEVILKGSKIINN